MVRCRDGTTVAAVTLQPVPVVTTGSSAPASGEEGVNGELLPVTAADAPGAPRRWWPWRAVDAHAKLVSRIDVSHLQAAAVQLVTSTSGATLQAVVAAVSRRCAAGSLTAALGEVEDTPWFTSGAEVVAALLLRLHGKADVDTWWAAAGELGIARHFAPVSTPPPSPAAALGVATYTALVAAWRPALCIRSPDAWRAAMASLDATWLAASGGAAPLAHCVAAARWGAAAATLALPLPRHSLGGGSSGGAFLCPVHDAADLRPAFLARLAPTLPAGAPTSTASSRVDTDPTATTTATAPLSLLDLLRAFAAL